MKVYTSIGFDVYSHITAFFPGMRDSNNGWIEQFMLFLQLGTSTNGVKTELERCLQYSRINRGVEYHRSWEAVN